jgi:choline dehydrogenase
MSPPDMEICLVHRAPFGSKFFDNVIKRVQTGEPPADLSDLIDLHLVLGLPGLVRPFSRGSVKLASTVAADYPKISANVFGDSRDLDRMVGMIELTRRIFAADSLRVGLGMNEISPGPDVTSRDELVGWVKENTGSYYHFAGSAKMGTDRMAVVDPKLKVHGTAGLRVVDGSVMPTVVSANPHATIVAIAERAADLLRDGI